MRVLFADTGYWIALLDNQDYLNTRATPYGSPSLGASPLIPTLSPHSGESRNPSGSPHARQSNRHPHAPPVIPTRQLSFRAQPRNLKPPLRHPTSLPHHRHSRERGNLKHISKPNPVSPHTYSSSPNFKSAKNASCGTSTRPTRFIRRFPSACFSSNFRFRDTSPP